MGCLHLLLVEDKNTRDDRTRFICENDPRWHDRQGYMLNKLLRFLLEKGDVFITPVLDTDIPCHVCPNSRTQGDVHKFINMYPYRPFNPFALTRVFLF